MWEEILTELHPQFAGNQGIDKILLLKSILVSVCGALYRIRILVDVTNSSTDLNLFLGLGYIDTIQHGQVKILQSDDVDRLAGWLASGLTDRLAS